MKQNSYDHNGITISYLEGGKGKSILFFHGVGLQATTYKKTLFLLSEKYHVIAPDIFGFGRSDIPPDNWHFPEYAVYFEEFLKKKRIHDVTLIGHSLGGRIALALAQHSKRVRKLLLVDSSPTAAYFQRDTNYAVKLVLNTLFEFAVKKNYGYIPVLLDLAKTIPLKPNRTIRLRKLLLQAVLHDDYSIGSINVPTLILWGQYDRVIPLSYSEELAHLIPHATLQVVPGDHIWCITHPEYFLDVVSSYIEQP